MLTSAQVERTVERGNRQHMEQKLEDQGKGEVLDCGKQAASEGRRKCNMRLLDMKPNKWMNFRGCTGVRGNASLCPWRAQFPV